MKDIKNGTATLQHDGEDKYSLYIENKDEEGVFTIDIALTEEELRDIHFVITQRFKLYD